MSVITDILGAFGLSEDIASALFTAENDPTSANLQAVVNAYAAHGMVVPGQIMAHLVSENEKRHPEDTYTGRGIGWLVAGAAALFLLLRRGR